jgi:hypothetical protein
MSNKTIYSIIGFGILIILAIIGFGISEAVLYSNRHDYLGSSKTCPIFPNQTYFKAEKDIWSQWHWTYQFDGISATIEQMCPTLRHDTRVRINGQTVVESDGKVFSWTGLTYVFDCHGDKIFSYRADDYFQYWINGIQIWISYLLRDAGDTKTLAYVEGKSFWNTEFDIKNEQGQIIAHMKKNFWTIPWDWTFNIYHDDEIDMRVLALLAGHTAFSEKNSDHKDQTDGCNSYFYGIAYTFIAFAVLVFCAVCYGIYRCYKNRSYGSGSSFLLSASTNYV